MVDLAPTGRGRDEGSVGDTRRLSGYYGLAWHWKSFTCPENDHAGGPYLLRFRAVDYLAEVWLNGEPVGSHEGGETPFVLDVTGAIRPGRGNLLAVRVLNPTNEPIDGIALDLTPHRNKAIPFSGGRSYNQGGIVDSVDLLATATVRVADLWAHADPATGGIRVKATLVNAGQGSASCSLECTVAFGAVGDVVAGVSETLTVHAGESEACFEIPVPQPRMWDLSEPNLYRVTARVTSQDGADERTVRCGFRDFRFENGTFRLNGRRIYMKGSHTGNHTPVGFQVPHDPDILRRDLILVKAMGFNLIRFIAGVAYPYQLDLCDEIGLLVYEESFASWLLGDSPHMKERYDRSTREMILRDRNHPSIVIWGMLNETDDGPVFRHAVDALSLVRKHDPTRLVLLNSGRWDCDQTIGSLSNPYSEEWEHHLGGEAHGAAKSSSTWGGYFEQAGDAHAYPRVPHTAEIISFLRTVGHDTKPILITEYGIGSAVDLWRVVRHFERIGKAEADDARFYRKQLDAFMIDWKRWGMDEIFGHPGEYFTETQRKMAAQRELGLNAIRSNPKIVGHNVTGTVDQGMTGEGVFTTFRELKPGTTDAISECFAPLRWCLFAEPINARVGDAVTLEAVLADEDVLAPGEYPVHMMILAPDGRKVWQREATVAVPDDPHKAFSTSVFREDVALDGPAGEYRFIVRFQEGAAATGGETRFRLHDPAEGPHSGAVRLCGCPSELATRLSRQGFTTSAFDPSSPAGDTPVIVGADLPDDHRADTLAALVKAAEAGATVAFLSQEAFGSADDALDVLPFPGEKKRHRIGGWLYLKDEWTRRHPIFDGLPSGGLMDYAVYRDVIPDAVYVFGEAPDEVVAGAIKTSQDYDSGLMVSVHRHGRGRIIMSTLHLIDRVGTDPVAERILRNMIAYAGE